MSAGALPRLVLASGSPRRREILERLGIAASVRPAAVDERPRADEEPRRYVERLARAKAGARVEAGELILAADTVVVHDEVLLGKPADDAEARRMLAALAGTEHRVLTAVALHDPDPGRTLAGVETTRVRMSPMGDDEIAWYVATGEPMDKAGAYAVQGLGGLFVEEVLGNYSNVVGLPLPLTYRLFHELGYDLRRFRDPSPRAGRAGLSRRT